MPGRYSDDSVHREPHLSKGPFTPDNAEPKVEEHLELERLARDAERERAEHSVFNEPATLPNRPPAP